MPRFSCPTCGRGLINILQDTLIKKHPAWIANLPELGDEFSDASKNDVRNCGKEEFITSLFLKCDNKGCGEIIASIGLLKDEMIVGYDKYGGWCSYEERFYPASFYPAIHLLEIPLKTPESIKSKIVKSFPLFWLSPSACGNAIRISVERLLDECGVLSKKLNSKGNEIELPLHARIEEFGKKFEYLSNLLFAIKWIGNDGSHASDLKVEDVIIA